MFLSQMLKVRGKFESTSSRHGEVPQHLQVISIHHISQPGSWCLSFGYLWWPWKQKVIDSDESWALVHGAWIQHEHHNGKPGNCWWTHDMILPVCVSWTWLELLKEFCHLLHLGPWVCTLSYACQSHLQKKIFLSEIACKTCCDIACERGLRLRV